MSRKIAICALFVTSVSACSGNGQTPIEAAFNLTPSTAAATETETDTNIETEAEISAAARSETGYIAVNAFPALEFDKPVFAAALPNGNKLLVLEQAGQLLSFDNAPTSTDAKVVLDISSRTLFAGEQGLLGLAFDPLFLQNRKMYLYYSADNPRRSVIASFEWDNDRQEVDDSSEVVLLQIPQPYSNHNGGMLAFGPDGYLYVGVGDGGSGGDPENHAQNRSSLLGSVLRIDTQPGSTAPYSIPTDNPFTNTPGARAEIFAYGLRNPFRFSFDRQAGTLWLADVGQNEAEEINIVTAGGNYGWRVFEGSREYNSSSNTLPNTAFDAPVFEYDHGAGISVTGGVVYRGQALENLAGQYLYADYGSGSVWRLSWDGVSASDNTLIANVPAPAAFVETASGEVLIVSRHGTLYKLIAAPN